MIINYLKGQGLLYNKNNSPLNTKKTENYLTAMENTEQQIEALKELIREELKDCNPVLWPKVCEMQSTARGLEKMEDMIIRYVANEGMGIGSAIAIIEQELSHIH